MHAGRSINFSRGVPILNEEDLRDCFAMFAMCGVLMEGFVARNSLTKEVAELSYEMADAMLEARKPKEEAGIASVKRVRKAK
jgi:hypothetical protein